MPKGYTNLSHNRLEQTMELINKEKKVKFDILLILAMLIVARISCPALSNIPLFNMAFTFIYGTAFVALYILSVKRIKKQDLYLIVAALLYTLYVFIRVYMAGNSIFARDSFNAYIIVFLTMIYIWVKEKPLATKVLLFKLIFAALIFDYVYSIWVLWQDPGASRTSAAIGVLEKSPADVLNAVGSFDAVYGGLSVIVILLCMRQIFKEKRVKNKTSLLVLILALVFVIMASYGTALVLLVLSLALFSGQKNRAASVVLLLSLVLILVFHESFGQLIMDLSNSITYSETASEKMYEFGYMLKTFEAAGTYAGESGRAARMMWAWETFKNYPIFGGMGMPNAKVGGHCELLDFPGNFGLVGFALLATYFVYLYRNIRVGLSSRKMSSCWKIIMFVFIISAALNPSLYSLQMMPMILMISLAPSYIEMCEKKKISGEQL